jgi:hypothetical protein
MTDLRTVEVHVTDDKGGETMRRFHPDLLLSEIFARHDECHAA